jgi:hypothetical protein
MTEITRSQKHLCAARELHMRMRVYPGWVRAGRMKQEDADREIATMAAIVEDYRLAKLADGQEPV